MSQVVKAFSREKYQATHPVEPQHAGMRLDQFVKIHFPSFSREVLKNKISKGEIFLTERLSQKPSTKIKHGESVCIIIHQTVHEDEWWRGQKLILDSDPEVLHETEDFLVINKPPFMAVHPTGRHIFNCATVYFEQEKKMKVFSIHRLDRETSGVMLLGKNVASTQKLTQLFEHSQIKKCYFLIGEKKDQVFPDFPLLAQERLGREPDDTVQEAAIDRLLTQCYPPKTAFGKKAVTRFELIERNDNFLTAFAYPQTGRQHQIRAHAAHHGFSLLGDKLYGHGPELFLRYKDGLSDENDYDLLQIPRQALHAYSIAFTLDEKDYEFKAPLPQDLKDWLEKKQFKKTQF